MDLSIDDLVRYSILIFIVVAVIVIAIKVAPNFLGMAEGLGGVQKKLF